MAGRGGWRKRLEQGSAPSAAHVLRGAAAARPCTPAPQHPTPEVTLPAQQELGALGQAGQQGGGDRARARVQQRQPRHGAGSGDHPHPLDGLRVLFQPCAAVFRLGRVVLEAQVEAHGLPVVGATVGGLQISGEGRAAAGMENASRHPCGGGSLRGVTPGVGRHKWEDQWGCQLRNVSS